MICDGARDDLDFKGRSCEDCIRVIRQKYGHQSWQRLSKAEVAAVKTTVQETRLQIEERQKAKLSNKAEMLADILAPFLKP